MDYENILEYCIENNIQLDDDQLKTLQEKTAFDKYVNKKAGQREQLKKDLAVAKSDSEAYKRYNDNRENKFLNDRIRKAQRELKDANYYSQIKNARDKATNAFRKLKSNNKSHGNFLKIMIMLKKQEKIIEI